MAKRWSRLPKKEVHVGVTKRTNYRCPASQLSMILYEIEGLAIS